MTMFVNPEPDIQKEIAHIYDLLRKICTFKKVCFDAGDNWTQSSDGYFKLELPCVDYIALAAFEDIAGAKDRRANCTIDANSQVVTVTSTVPFKGYIVAANVDFDEDNGMIVNDRVIVENELNDASYNPVTNKAVTLAINAVKAQATMKTVMPKSLPASDVYSWAKAPEKPCYTWQEICCKPDVVTDIMYGAYAFRNCKGVVDLSALNCMLDIPKRVSELIVDIKLSDIADDINLLDSLKYFADSIDNFGDETDELREMVETEIADRKEADEKTEADVAANKESIASLKKELDADVLLLKGIINTSHNECSATCTEAIAKVQKAVDDAVVDYKAQDNSIKALISNLAYKCDREHENIHEILDKMYAELVAIKPTSVSNLEAQITKALAKAEEAKAQAEASQTVANTAKTIANSAKEDAATAQAAADEAKKEAEAAQTTADEAKDEAETAQATADDNTKAIEELKKTAEESIAGVTDDVTALKTTVDSIPENLSELLSKVTTTGVLVEESDKNGYVTVKTPKTDDDGAVVKDDTGATEYTSEDIKVYSLAVPDDTDAEAKAVWDSLVTEEELSKTISAMTTTAKVSAIINYDENNGDQYINISESSGLIWVNGERVTLNVTKVETAVTELKETVAAQAEEIADLKSQLAQLWSFVGSADANDNKTFDEGEKTLGDKQDAANAVTDEDAMTASELEEILKNS